MVSASIEAKKTDLAHKDRICYDLETTLDEYYNRIKYMLCQLEDEPDEQEMGLQIDFICKNLDPTDPGVRDLASFARFDFIEKCSKA